MISAPIPGSDEERIASLRRMNVLSTAREQDIDRITRCVQKYFKVEIVLVTLVDRNRQWFKSKCGLDISETSRDISFCGHAIMEDAMLLIEDTLRDERFFDNPLVTGAPHIRFYAGQPLVNREGHRYGTLCVISKNLRTFSVEDVDVLEDFAGIVQTVMDNRTLSEAQESLLTALEDAKRDKLLDPLTGLWNKRGMEELFERELSRAVRESEPIAVGLISVNDLDVINEKYGHDAVSATLKISADTLVKWARPYDIVSRFGQDEFLFVAPNVTPVMIPTLGWKLLKSFRMSASFEFNGVTIEFTVSAGFTGSPPRADTNGLLNAMLERAREALALANQNGKDRYEVFGVSDSFSWDAPIY
jgi:diguanylate cyclase (GGDEF)-like protein